jgi:hypothetical protein
MSGDDCLCLEPHEKQLVNILTASSSADDNVTDDDISMSSCSDDDDNVSDDDISSSADDNVSDSGNRKLIKQKIRKLCADLAKGVYNNVPNEIKKLSLKRIRRTLCIFLVFGFVHDLPEGHMETSRTVVRTLPLKQKQLQFDIAIVSFSIYCHLYSVLLLPGVFRWKRTGVQ